MAHPNPPTLFTEREWRAVPPAAKKEYRRIERILDYRRRKREAFIALGSECAYCGFDDTRILQIDHKQARSQESPRNQIAVYQEILSGSAEYQLLCPNCNWTKRVEEEEAPHSDIDEVYP